ncbi:MAG: energy transducer TonB [Acidobacteria bacterium]|nr:energy transducer TonB [Acidobacteriota bacterium]
MPNDHTWTEPDPLGGNFAGSAIVHALVLGGVVAAGFLVHRGSSWGAATAQAGAIQATMVTAIPLPATQRFDKDQVLTSDAPSPAPKEPTPQTIAPPKPDEVPIPVKQPPKPPKVAQQETPAPPKHPQPIQPPKPNVAQTGETSGIRIQQSTMQVTNGTASVAVQDSAFGARYAYYVNVVNRTVAQNWFTREADPVTSVGRSVTIIFDILRDGTPSNVRMGQRSGSPSLDASALHALERVDGFGPLPAGDHITVEYTFHYQPH